MKNLFLLICNLIALVAICQPTTSAPDPTREASSVISLFSNEYQNVPVDTWRTEWSAATLDDIQINGNDTKRYTNLDFVGIETVTNTLDLSGVNHIHLDIWTPNMTTFRVKLVDFGPDGMFQGGDDSEHEIVLTNLPLNQWHAIDIPLPNFSNLISKEHIAQLILSGLPVGEGTVFIDNVYFYFADINIDEPSTAALDPTRDPADVISLFSGVYTNVPVDTWRTEWSAATLEDIQINGNDTKKYSNLDFVGVETVANTLDLSNMSHLHLDIWTPNMTTFRVKLVDFGPDGMFQGGDDSEHEIVFEGLPLAQWNSIDIPLDDFVNLTSTAHIAQMIFSGLPVGGGTVYIDNVYYYTSMVSTSDKTLESLKIYPNPSLAGTTFILENQIVDIAVWDIQGKLRYHGQGHILPTDGFDRGTYIVKASDTKGTVYMSKLVLK